MFLYRRQGPKKRAKTTPPRKNRGPQKGLPNSARDLLPLIQPATKALAQMLAGRTAASGQLGHARAILAQIERLMADRAHNRLNPAEREEFFEQIARLRLTLSDAESEAEALAAEPETPASVSMPVNRERLKEMALALTSSTGSTSYEDRHVAPPALNETPAEESPPPDPSANGHDLPVSDATPGDEADVVKRSSDPNQLRLPRAVADRVTINPGKVRGETNGRRLKAKLEEPRILKPSEPAETIAEQDVEAKSSTVEAKSSDQQKLPKGWIIDDEGFVVPGPA